MSKIMHYMLVALMTTLFGGSVAEAASSAAAANFVVMEPMTKVLSKSDIRDCRGGEGKNLTVIPWGADLFVVHGNGNSATTQPGSIFANKNLNVTLSSDDDFVQIAKDFLSCKTPYLRATYGQALLLADITESDARTKLIPVNQLSWSNGGDLIVVSKEIIEKSRGMANKAAALKGAIIAMQRYAPQTDYLFSILKEGGLTPADVKIVYTDDLLGVNGNTPGAAFLEKKVDAAVVILPDGLSLTSGGNIGDGSEDSRAGAEVFLSTKDLNRQIADMYFVRADYEKIAPKEVQALAEALLLAEEATVKLIREQKTRKAEFDSLIKAGATIILKAPTDINVMRDMWLDAETTGFAANKRFFTDTTFTRGFVGLGAEISQSYVSFGLLNAATRLSNVEWNYDKLAAGVPGARSYKTESFDSNRIQAYVENRARSGLLEGDGFKSVELRFPPNESEITITPEIKAQFEELARSKQKFGGTVMTIEAHADIQEYRLAKFKRNESPNVLMQIKKAAETKSVDRALFIRDTFIKIAENVGVPVDKSQVAIVGYGITKPKFGSADDINGKLNNRDEWLANMRVDFRIVRIKAESDEFIKE